ncbi:MAG: LapA family protein [Spirochaetes bacterium]|jgi:uncharacterized integral membrane protein|nr:LapA family protein [Spirochaetota bacterium]
MSPKTISIAAGSLLVLIISIQNYTSVSVNILFWDFSARLIILLIVFLAMGFGAGYYFAKSGKDEQLIKDKTDKNE